MTSVTLGDVKVVKSVDVQSYVGFKPSTARKSVSLLRRSETRPLMIVRASTERDISVKSSGLSIEECEAAAVAGNFPDPPPPRRPSAPKGTPNVNPLVCLNYEFLTLMTVQDIL